MNRYGLAAAVGALLVGVGGSEAHGRSQSIGDDRAEATRGWQDAMPLWEHPRATQEQARAKQSAKPQGQKPEQGQKPQQAQKQQQRQKPQQAQQQQQRQKPQAQKPQRAQKQQQAQKPARGRGQGGQGARGQSGERAQPAQRGQGSAQRGEPQRGQSENARTGQGRRGDPTRAVRRVSRPVQLERLPERMRPLARSSNPSQRAAAIAVARGSERSELAVTYAIVGDRVRLLNGRNELLLDISDRDARGLGYWDVRRLDPRRVRNGSPAFCRSGAGHPVWGREWCIDKGFGLGASDGWLWGRHNPDDVVFRPVSDRVSLDRGGLIDVLGSVVFDRLALHAITLGLADPLAGRWIGEPAGPRVMVLDSGSRPIAELIDLDRDGRVDVMYVTSR
jgi:hypothetical protein